MVKILVDLSILKRDLLFEIREKIVNNKTQPLNEYFDSNYKIEINAIKNLLDTIEQRLRNCEIIYYTYFENIDHTSLNGATMTTPKIIDIQYAYGTSVVKNRVQINDSIAYIDIITREFRLFILHLSTLYENISRLTEILIKKIIIHHKKNKPLSSPHHILVDHWEILMNLSYRDSDNCYNCISLHRAFLDEYAGIINLLRNIYMHGYTSNLYPDGADYKISNLTNNFTQGSPKLTVDVFVNHVLQNTKQLVTDFIGALISDMKIPGQTIPM